MSGIISDQSSNKRIAKNTLLLYFRMLLTMGVSLYTSRVVLNVLGIEDFGIYNVVGGIVMMLGFVNSAMTSSSQRYLTYELGKGDYVRLGLVFNTSLFIHFLICVVVVILAETVGLWFLLNKMTIANDRVNAAFWVYQFSILSVVVTILSVPYNACIVAHERMKAFAYISVIEVILKLLIVYVLVLFDFDKLILYAFLMFLVLLNSRIIYGYYCKKHFSETKVKFSFDKKLFNEMSGFAGWSLIGDASSIAYTQGVNLLLNIFFGPSVNAARGISVQVQTTVNNFCSNFQMAINPQITKSYASNDLIKLTKLVYTSSKLSFFLLLVLSLPIIISADTILFLWLKIVPEHTVNFVRLMLLISVFDTLANPLIVTAKATGNIKNYQLKVATIVLLIVPLCWFFLRIGYPPESVFIIHLIIVIIAQTVRVVLVHHMVNLPIYNYLVEVLIKVGLVLFFCLLSSYCIYYFLSGSSFYKVFICSVLSVSSTLLIVYFFGLEYSERDIIKNKIKIVFSKILKNN